MAIGGLAHTLSVTVVASSTSAVSVYSVSPGNLRSLHIKAGPSKATPGVLSSAVFAVNRGGGELSNFAFPELMPVTFTLIYHTTTWGEAEADSGEVEGVPQHDRKKLKLG